jgi:hypothetical protein
VSKTIFRIENGVLAFELVDTAAVGYLPTWQAPMGGVLPTVTAADYDTSTDSFQCQLVTGVLQSTPQSTTENLDGTWCDLPEVITIAGEDTFGVALDVYQDANIVGLAAYLYENRGKKAYAYFGMGTNPGDPPTAIGVVTLSAVAVGGGRQANRAQVTFPFDRAPDIQFGNATASRVVFGDRDTPAIDVPGVVVADADADAADADAA